MKQIKEQIYKYVDNPLSPEINFNTGLHYEAIGQTAAALSFFLRCAELTDDQTLAYEALLKTHNCISSQGRRPVWEKEQLMIAMTHYPERPEAYFLLSQWHSAREEWTEAHHFAVAGQKLCDLTLPPLGSNVGYIGHWGLKFQEAFTCWYRGLRQHSYKLWLELYNDKSIDNDEYFQIIINNCTNFNLIQTKHDPIIYDSSQYDNVEDRFKFPSLPRMENNYSQCFQDLFVLKCFTGKKRGTYLEIGGGRPFDGNNTALLEKIGWDGLSIDLHQPYVDEWNESIRSNPIIRTDATQIDYKQLFKDHNFGNVIDYLQIDIDPCTQSYDVLTKIPFEEVKFGVITFEHDHYVDPTRKIRNKSRNLLESHGYILAVGNVSPDENSPFEDWWVHPQVITEAQIKKVKTDLKDVLPIKSHFYKNAQ